MSSGGIMNAATTNSPSRKLFRNYFKARHQSMQNVVTDTFYTLVPGAYKVYYNAFIRQWMQWASGFVPMLHSQDFFSLGLGYAVCEIFSKECLSGGFRIESGNRKFKDFLDKWVEDNALESLEQQKFFWTNAGGNSFLCLTPVGGELYPSVIPVNRIVFSCDRKGMVTQAVIFQRFIAGESKAYYTRETRVLLDGKPFYKVEICESGGQATSPSFAIASTLNRVPPQMDVLWKYSYGDIVPNEWYNIPRINSLGLYNVKNSPVSVALSELPGYSDSTLHTSLDILYGLDYNYTQGQVDQYRGETKVIAPKVMMSRQAIIPPSGSRTTKEEIAASAVMGVSRAEAMQGDPIGDKDIFLYVQNPHSLDGKPFEPIPIQWDLRGEVRKFIRDADIELLASKTGLSSSTLANHLANNQVKTATEISSEQDTTEKSVAQKRRLASLAVNEMLRDLAAFYGFEGADDVHIVYGSSKLPSTAEKRALLEEYKASVLPLEEYIKERRPQLTEDDVKRWSDSIKIEANSAQSEFGRQFIHNNYFKDLDNI